MNLFCTQCSLVRRDKLSDHVTCDVPTSHSGSRSRWSRSMFVCRMWTVFTAVSLMTPWEHVMTPEGRSEGPPGCTLTCPTITDGGDLGGCRRCVWSVASNSCCCAVVSGRSVCWKMMKWWRAAWMSQIVSSTHLHMEAPHSCSYHSWCWCHTSKSPVAQSSPLPLLPTHTHSSVRLVSLGLTHSMMSFHILPTHEW